MCLNLFMQHMLSLVTQDSCTSKKGRFGANWHVIHGKDLKKYSWKIKYFIHQCKDLLTQISTLIHWHTYTNHNPNAKNLEAAPKPKNTLCNFW